MKILKYLFLLSILAIFGLIVFIATQKSTINFQKSIFIKVPRTVVFDYLIQYRNWELWASWREDDNSIQFKYPQSNTGKEGSLEWNGIGSYGKIVTTQIVTNHMLLTKIDFDGSDLITKLVLKDSIGGTKLTWKVAGAADFPTKIMSSFSGGINKFFQNTFERSLNNLNITLTNEINKFDIQTIGFVSIPARYYIKTLVVCKPSEMQTRIANTIPKIESFFKVNNLKMNGKPFVINEALNNDTVKLGIYGPAKEAILLNGNKFFTTGLMEGFTALKTVLKGDYSHLNDARSLAQIEFNKQQLRPSVTAQPMEVYFKTVSETNKPSKWVTFIQQPIYSRPRLIPKIYRPKIKRIPIIENTEVPTEPQPEKDEF
ncbi:MAG: hypothetical protein RLZZ312_1812 [Bacteroidota bacterium]|jgi:hypothetical protein